MTKSTAERQRAYKARKQAQGLVRVAEWVHKDDVELLRFRAKAIRMYREIGAQAFQKGLLANVDKGRP